MSRRASPNSDPTTSSAWSPAGRRPATENAASSTMPNPRRAWEISTRRVRQAEGGGGSRVGAGGEGEPSGRRGKIALQGVTTKLDALSHFHFAPKPVMEEMAAKDAPALEAEEVAPAMAGRVAKSPEEIFAGGENQEAWGEARAATSNPRGCPARNARRRARAQTQGEGGGRGARTRQGETRESGGGEGEGGGGGCPREGQGVHVRAAPAGGQSPSSQSRPRCSECCRRRRRRTADSGKTRSNRTA